MFRLHIVLSLVQFKVEVPLTLLLNKYLKSKDIYSLQYRKMAITKFFYRAVCQIAQIRHAKYFTYA